MASCACLISRWKKLGHSRLFGTCGLLPVKTSPYCESGFQYLLCRLSTIPRLRSVLVREHALGSKHPRMPPSIDGVLRLFDFALEEVWSFSIFRHLQTPSWEDIALLRKWLPVSAVPPIHYPSPQVRPRAALCSLRGEFKMCLLSPFPC